MPEDLKVEIIRVTPDVRLNQWGSVDRWTKIEYRVGRHGPFSVEMPTSVFTAAEARRLVDAQAAEIIKLLKSP